ncbi:peptidoglycan editing factor PgeF [soil metagenome]
MKGKADSGVAINDASIQRIQWPGLPANVHALTSTRIGGVSIEPYGNGNAQGGLNLGDHVGDDAISVALNRQLFNRHLPSTVSFLSQVHGSVVVDAGHIYPGQIADACFTSSSSVVCAVLTADCLPVLLCDKKGTVVAAAHAGWRGLAAGILQSTVSEMRESGAQEIMAWMGPAIGPEKFEVGQDVLDVFCNVIKDASKHFVLKHYDDQGKRKYLADIYGLARSVLFEFGVVAVDGGTCCTFTEEDKFYSYRRDGITGRMASAIWID